MAYRSQGETVVARRADGSRPRPSSLVSNDIEARRLVAPAEAAQARLFEEMLRTEIVELLNLPPEGQAEMRSRIAELDRLIKALRSRFPHPPTTLAPLARELRPTTDRAPRALLN